MSKRLDRIKERLNDVSTSQVIDPTGRNATADVRWLIDRVERLEGSMEDIKWGKWCTACSCRCHQVADKALAEEE